MSRRVPSRPAIVGAWRKYLGLSQRAMASSQLTQASTVANWEQGLRGAKISRDAFESYTARLGLDSLEHDAFVDMWAGLPPTLATHPREQWRANLAFDGGPAWAWIVPNDESNIVPMAIWWGEDLEPVELTRNPVVIQFEGSIPNPPLEITLPSPGWVIFGRGRVPESVVTGLGSMLVTGNLPSGEAFVPWRSGLSGMFASLEERRRGTLERSVAGDSPWMLATAAEPVLDKDGNTVSQLLLSPNEARSLRESTGLSRIEVANMASELDSANPLSAGAVRGLEEGRRVTTSGIIWRLDHIYGCDGRLGLDRTVLSIARGSRIEELRYPKDWVGPVWVQFRGPVSSAAELITLWWGNWKRDQILTPRFTITTRKAFRDFEPLRVSVPDGWQLIAGVGLPPAAMDVNRGWEPVSAEAGRSLVAGSRLYGQSSPMP